MQGDAQDFEYAFSGGQGTMGGPEPGKLLAAWFGGTDEGYPTGIFYNDTWELGPGIVTPPGNPRELSPF